MPAKKSLRICLSITSTLILGMTEAPAGSAVASGPYGEHVVVAGPNYSKKGAEQKALALWHSNWNGQPKILVSSESGYGAVAVWDNGDTWALGAVAGKASPQEADKEAIRYCLQRCPASAKPKIIRRFKA
jgi:hypothetical protein